MTCLSALYCGKICVASEHCERVVWGFKIEPIFVLLFQKPATLHYSLHGPLTLQCERPNETRKDVELGGGGGGGFLRRPPTCCRSFAASTLECYSSATEPRTTNSVAESEAATSSKPGQEMKGP
jgi:hypothetical protein